MGSGREIKPTQKSPCEWCAAARECDSERRTDVKAKFVVSRYCGGLLYHCPDHEPVWFKGIEGCAP